MGQFEINMPTSRVLKMVQENANLNPTTKQFIINFCNGDADKKITNEGELALLNAWAAGDEKVALPKLSGENSVLKPQESLKKDEGLGLYFKSYKITNTSKDGGKLTKHDLYSMENPKEKNTKFVNSGFTWESNKETVAPGAKGPSQTDAYYDDDNDGKIDSHIYSTYSYDKKTNISTIETYADLNMDGKFDTLNRTVENHTTNTHTQEQIDL